MTLQVVPITAQPRTSSPLLSGGTGNDTLTFSSVAEVSGGKIGAATATTASAWVPRFLNKV